MSIKIFFSKEERQKRKQLRKEKRLAKKELRRKKLSTRKWVLPAVIASVILYAIFDIILQVTTNSEISPTLTTCWFTFWGVELWNLASITKKKVDVDYDGSYTGNLNQMYEDENEDVNEESEDETNGRKDDL